MWLWQLYLPGEKLHEQGKFLSYLQRLYNLSRKLHWYLINIGHSHEQNHIITICKTGYDRDVDAWKSEYLVNEQVLRSVMSELQPIV